MSRLPSARACVVFVLAIAALAGCARDEPDVVEVGRHHLRLRVPQGWQRLDHGRVQLFRKGEAEIALMDHGPADRAAIVREIRDAEQVWRDGRWADAIARLHELSGAPLDLASTAQVSAFWSPWRDAPADSATLEGTFDALVMRIDSLPEPSLDQLGDLVVGRALKDPRREIARKESSNDRLSWVVIDTWDKTSHLNPSRLAWAKNGDDLLVLTIERRRGDTTDDAFQALLASIEPAR